MKKIFLLILMFSIFVGGNNLNYSYATSNNEIEKMYNDLIYKVEERTNNQIKEIEKNYSDSIERAKNNILNAEKLYETTKQNIAKQSNAAASYNINLANKIAQEGQIQLNNMLNNINNLKISLDNLYQKKEVEVNNIRNNIQTQIDNYNIEKNNSLNQNNSIKNNQTINNNVNSNNSCGLNSYLTSYGKCDCNVGYFWEDVKDMKNFNCVKQTDTQMCQEIYGFYSYGDKDYCYCSAGYTWNTGITACIKEVPKEEEKLSDSKKRQIDKVFEIIKHTFAKLTIGKKEKSYNNINTQIDSLILKQKSQLNKEILTYLKSLIDNELENITNEEIDLNDVFSDLFGENNFKCGDNISIKQYSYSTKLMPDGKCWTTTNIKHIPDNGESYCYNGDEKNCDKYGGLYDLEGAVSACKMLGNGWKLPNFLDWTALINKGATGWKGNKIFGIGTSLPGTYTTDGTYGAIGEFGFYRINSQASSLISLNGYLDYLRILEDGSSTSGFSAICIKS